MTSIEHMKGTCSFLVVRDITGGRHVLSDTKITFKIINTYMGIKEVGIRTVLLFLFHTVTCCQNTFRSAFYYFTHISCLKLEMIMYFLQ